jgi:iron(III) transport system ATP-binding protein
MTVTVENLTKRYDSGQEKVVAVDDVNFEVGQGELFTLLGPSGCGKTTTLRSLAGLESINTGTISIGGETVATPERSVKPENRDIGLVFQSYALWPHMTASENITYALKARGWPKDDRESRIAEVLDLIGLPEMGDRYPSELSGGQQQRIAFARAVSYEPSLLLMDEPLSNLDFKQRRRMRRLLLEMLDEVGITTVYVTHDQEEAFEISDETLVLDYGQAAQQGTPQELYESPLTPFVASLLVEANLFEATVTESDENGRAHCEIAGASTGVGIECTYATDSVPANPTVVIRPEDISAEQPEPEIRSDGSTVEREMNRFPGTVTQQYYRGSFTQNMVDVNDLEFMIKTDRPVMDEGQEVTLVVDPENATLVDTD